MIEEVKPPQPMDDTELLSIIDRERDKAHGYHDELSEQRRKALYYYGGEAKEDLAPPEVDGRSAVVSKDVMEAVEWALPSLVRIFTASDEVVAFQPTKPGQEKAAEDATTYCNWVLNGDSRNNGFVIFHDAIKNCLIQRMAWVKVYYEKKYDERQERYQGLSPPELAMLQQDPEVSIVSIEQEQEAVIGEGGMMMNPPMVTVTVIRREDASYCKVVGVPAEEVFFSKDDRDIEDLRFICHERVMTASDLISLGVDKDTVAGLGLDDGSEDEEETERDLIASKWNDDDQDGADDSQRTITVVEAYLKVDYDRDGVSEWRCVKKSGSVILSNDVVDDHPFSLFTPILMPYQLVGLSIYDLLADIQRIKTTLNRQMLDNIYLQNNARTEMVAGNVNLDDFLNPRPGGMVRVKQLGSMREIVPPNLVGNSLEAIQFVDGVRQRRSGITEMGSGLSPEAVNKQQAGITIDLLQQAARERIELIARVLAETGVKRLYRLILKCVTQYQNDAKQILVNGEFLELNPREWARSYNMQVSVGLGAQSKQAQVNNYQALLGLQQQLMQAGLTDVKRIGNAAAKLVEAMGHKEANQFIIDPSKLPEGQEIQGPPPPPDPNAGAMQIEQMRAQLKMQELQLKQQQDERDAQIRAQEIMMRNEAERQNDERNAGIEKYKADLDSQTRIAVAEINATSARNIEAMKIEADAMSQNAAALNEIQQIIAQARAAQGSDQMASIQAGLTAVMQQMTRPKVIMRDETGRAIGLQSAE